MLHIKHADLSNRDTNTNTNNTTNDSNSKRALNSCEQKHFEKKYSIDRGDLWKHVGR